MNTPIGAMQAQPIEAWGRDVEALRFSATLQTRTPLRVIGRHGEVFRGPGAPPGIATEQWHGVWMPHIPEDSAMAILRRPDSARISASEIGPVQSYGPFWELLKIIRMTVEADTSAQDRYHAIKSVLQLAEWRDMAGQMGGVETVACRFFPPFVDLLPGVGAEARQALVEAGIRTPAQLLSASDAALLSLKGIGKARIAAMRSMAARSPNPDSERADLVQR